VSKACVNDKYDIVVIGGGPAGLASSISAGANGAKVLIVDMNEELGGQLTKQTHKFFGSEAHYAGYRGFEIANILIQELKKFDVDIITNANVWNVAGKKIYISNKNDSFSVKFKKLIIATGAKERPVFFPKWTLPGVINAGALQTLVNIYRVTPGRNVVIIGSGNVGLIIAYQLVQADIEVKAIIEISNKVGGYNVHENKIRKLGIPIFLSSNINKAIGDEFVEGIEIVNNGKKKKIKTDVICIAAGMLSQNTILRVASIKLSYNKIYNDFLPVFNNEQNLEDNENIFVAGDVCGVSEASIAIDEGRLAGLCCCKALKLIKDSSEILKIKKRLCDLKNE
jgi:sarcosine oxidase, subunit alpha